MDDLQNAFPFDADESIDRLDVTETLLTVVGELAPTRVLRRPAASALATPPRLVSDVDRFIGRPRKLAA